MRFHKLHEKSWAMTLFQAFLMLLRSRQQKLQILIRKISAKALKQKANIILSLGITLFWGKMF